MLKNKLFSNSLHLLSIEWNAKWIHTWTISRIAKINPNFFSAFKVCEIDKSNVETESNLSATVSNSNSDVESVEVPCSIQKLEGPVEVYGYSVGEADDVTYVECGERCLQNAKCFSFAYNEINKKCFLKDQKHTSSSLLRSKNTKYFSAYLSGNCEKDQIPINCEWDEWKISECSKSCGLGTRNKMRTVKVEAANGGQVCDGPRNISEACNILSCPVDCRWGDWNFGECSKSCGGGVRFDTREKLIKALNGGKDCSGPSNITENCNIHDCPVDCQWDDWRESECSAECGGGILTKTRSKKVEAAHGGAQCSGLSSIEEDCNTQNCPVNCEWDEWKDGECSKSCGGGVRTNTRIEKINAAFGGKECTGLSTIEESCNIQECPIHNQLCVEMKESMIIIVYNIIISINLQNY